MFPFPEGDEMLLFEFLIKFNLYRLNLGICQ